MLAAMETRLMIFLALTSVTIVTNTLLIWFAYKTFATLTSTVTDALTEVERSDVTQAWLHSMQTAAKHAANFTERAKQKMTDVEGCLLHAQEQYGLALAKVDSKLEEVGNVLCANARKVRDAVAKPAFSIMSFTAVVNQLRKTFDVNE